MMKVVIIIIVTIMITVAEKRERRGEREMRLHNGLDVLMRE